MLELGPDEERLHREVGAHAATCADGIVAVGERGRWLADAAREAGSSRVSWVEDAEAAAEAVESTFAPGPGDLVLLKASRGIGLDRAVDRLTGSRP
jgi:UDP-N-acetylmuramoyl-tripeptide--D-alanyl-D-alanine ligase